MLYTWNDFDPILFQIPLEVIRHDHVQRVTMVLWIVQLCQDVFHGVKIEDSLTANIQGESADIADHFSLPCDVTVVFGTSWDEFCDNVTIEFIRHVPKKPASGDEGLTRAPFVHHTIDIIVKDLPTWRASNDS